MRIHERCGKEMRNVVKGRWFGPYWVCENCGPYHETENQWFEKDRHIKGFRDDVQELIK